MPPISRELMTVLVEQQRALDKLRPRHVAAIRSIATDLQGSLERRLKQMAPGAYTTQVVRTKVAQVRAVTEVLGAEYGQRLGTEVERVARLAARVGRDGLLDQIATYGERHKGSLQRIADVSRTASLLDPGLLEHYDSSRKTYGMEAIARMRGTLSRCAMEGKTIAQTWERLSKDIDIAEWQAERIVRTEQSFSVHRRQILDLIDSHGDEADLWRKQLVAVHDNRTGADSIYVDGQVRALTEEFEDNEGRRYQHPPNRPNDREAMVFLEVEEVEQAGVERPEVVQPLELPVALAAPTIAPKRNQPLLSAVGSLSGPRSRLQPTQYSERNRGRLRRASQRWLAQLPADQRKALRAWTNDWRRLLAAMKTPWLPTVTLADIAQVQLLYRAIESAPRWHGRGYRGIASEQLLDDVTSEAVQLKPGAVFHIAAVRSLSLDKAVALKFAVKREGPRRTIVLHVVRGGGPAEGLPYIMAAADPSYADQEEVLTPRDVQFRILRISRRAVSRPVGGKVVWYVVRYVDVEAVR